MPHPEGEAEKQEFSGSAGAPIVVKAPVEMVEPTGAETFLDIDAVAGEALVREVASVFGSTPLFVPCDLLDIDALRAAMAQVRTLLGDAAVLVNNAANDHRQVLAEVTPAEFDWVIGVNLKHVFASQAVVPQNNCLAGGHAARRHSEDEGHKPDPQAITAVPRWRDCQIPRRGLGITSATSASSRPSRPRPGSFQMEGYHRHARRATYE